MPKASGPGPAPRAAPEVTGSPGRWVGAEKGTTAAAAGLAGYCEGEGPCEGPGVDAMGAPRWAC
jgi:hypothetical protein